MATEYDTRPRDQRTPNDPYAPAGAQVTPTSPVSPGMHGSARAHNADTAASSGRNWNMAYIIGGLVVAAIVLFLVFGVGTSRDQTSPATIAPATQGTAPAGTGTGTAPATDGTAGAPADTGTGAAPAPGETTAPAGDAGTVAPADGTAAPATTPAN